jgi:hypothetical protein
MSDKPVLLRMKGSKESKPFEGAHAKRLLAYPNPQWEEVADKEPAAAAKAKTANTPPAGDTTGQPTSI